MPIRLPPTPGMIETPFHDKVSVLERMKQFAEKAARYTRESGIDFPANSYAR